MSQRFYMTLEMWITLGILVIAIILFITEWLRVDVVALGVVIFLMVSGILTPEEAIYGFSSPVVLTVAALFVVGGAALQTGLADAFGRRILALAGNSPLKLTAVIMGTVALLSCFISDMGTVAVMAPAILSISWRSKIKPSKLLLPLSIGSLLGGATTLIGTPPNIIVSNLLVKNGLAPFKFFDFTPIGLILLFAGIIFITITSRWLLPERTVSTDVQRVETPDELVQLYKLPEGLFRLRVRRRSPLAGQTLNEAALRQNFSVTVLEILRTPEPRAIAKVGDRRLVLQEEEAKSISPTPQTGLRPNDILICQGEPDDIAQASAYWKLGLQPAQADDKEALVNNEVGVAEVLLPPRSSLIGKTLVSTHFGSRYKLTVLDISRPREEELLSLKETELQFGDTLLVQGAWKDILALRKRRRDFVVAGQPEAMSGPPAQAKAPLALLILAGMLILLIANITPITTAAMLAGFLMVIVGCLSIDDAYEAVDWKSLVLIAGMLPMSTALQKVGLVNLGAEWLSQTLGQMGTIPIMATLFLITSIFTQVISNTATTVLIAPIAFSISQKLGVQPHAFLMLVAIASSTAFASPVASPVNTLVMGAGDYRFSDYLKVGVPLIFVSLIITVLVLPLLWPL
ncbi:MAG: SLC13 family permease [Chloroflexota bacterium]|nr:MAG: SLC13 family permease [Chloroflexota bacterium]